MEKCRKKNKDNEAQIGKNVSEQTSEDCPEHISRKALYATAAIVQTLLDEPSFEMWIDGCITY